MSTEIVHRAARTTPGGPEVESWTVERPPVLPEGEAGAGGLLMLVPMLGAGASMTVMMLFRGSSLAAVGALMMILTVIASVVMVFSQRGKSARTRRLRREAYLEYLERTRAELHAHEREFVLAARRAQPHTGALLSLARDRHRLWERRRGDVDFLRVRLGTGEVEVRRFQRQGESDPLQTDDDFMANELELVERRFRTAGDLPIDLDLDRAGSVSVVGDPDFCQHVARVLTTQAATLTSAEDLALALAAPPARIGAWRWAQWLPHLADQSTTTPEGPRRRTAPDVAGLQQVLRDELRRRLDTAAERRRNYLSSDGPSPHPALLVLLDHHGQPATGLSVGDAEISPAELGLTEVHLLAAQPDEPEDVRLRISQLEGDEALLERYERRDTTPHRTRLRLDTCTPAEAETLARHLAGVRLSPDSLEHDTSQQTSRVTELLGLDDVTAVDVDRAWAPRGRTAFLRVPIGTDDTGQPVMLDLKEAAQFGMGPHGLCVGATGSGKSELLRTLVLALLSTHGPDDVSMVLVDYKGGATFAPFADAPQVSGVITNLSDDAMLVERVYASLSGEVQRRQQVLKDAGNLADVTAYRRRRAERAREGETMAALPHLLVIIDEFGELLTARPDFIDLFLSIGRIGRSIGVHLLLSSQRIEGGKLRGLDTYLSYRIGLRTLSEAESRTVLDTPDAFALPALPGYGYLKVDTTIYTRFRSGYVSGELPAVEDVPADLAPRIGLLQPYARLADDTGPGPAASEEDEEDDEGPQGPTVLSSVIGQLARRPPTGEPVWLPPMPDQLTLDQIGAGLMVTTAGVRMQHGGPMRVPMGVVDDPAKQWQGAWELDLDRSGGNVLVIGGPRTGRTTFLRTLTASLAVTHGADEAVVYGIDLLGSNLQVLDELPNVAGIGVRMEVEVVRRTLEEVSALLQERERVFQALRTESLAAARSLAAAGEERLRGLMLAEVVLLVDGYGQLGEEFESVEPIVQNLLRRGSGYGIHLVATANRWNEVRINQQTFFGTKIELRLGDPSESAAGRKLAQTLVDAPPGRVLLESKLFAQVALPRIDGRADRTSVTEGLADLVQEASRSAAERAPRVRLLPAVVEPSTLAPPARPGQVPLGLDESDLATVALDLDGADRNLVVIGDSQTGRTSLLRHLVTSLVQRHTDEEIVFAVIDPRRTLHGAVPEDHLGGYAGSTAMAEQLVAAILPELQKRAPQGPEVVSGPAPLPRIVVVVDDYDVLTAAGASPLRPLLPFVAMGHEVNLDVVLTRRTGGAARGVYEPAFAAIRDSGATGVMFSGDRAEGQLLGTVRPRKLPVGRALLVRTGEPVRTVQVAHQPPTEEALEGRGFGAEADEVPGGSDDEENDPAAG